jgi:hypothetical protein
VRKEIKKLERKLKAIRLQTRTEDSDRVAASVSGDYASSSNVKKSLPANGRVSSGSKQGTETRRFSMLVPLLDVGLTESVFLSVKMGPDVRIPRKLRPGRRIFMVICSLPSLVILR